MDLTTIGVSGVVALLLLILAGLHIGLVLALIGGIGVVIIIGLQGGLNIIGSAPFATASVYDFSPVPLFLLMGAFATNGELGTAAYDAVNKWVGKLHGGLAIASTFGAAFFGLASGSSLAATAMFTKIALPEMLKRGYNRELAIGSIASAGTFSTMIPPSGLLIIYAIFTEESIGRLFMAGIFPGIITAICYVALIYFRVWRKPELAPKIDEDIDLGTKLSSLLQTWPMLLLGVFVLGGIFTGWFTATEAGGMGALGALLIAIMKKGVRGARIQNAFMDCMQTTGMIFLIVIGAAIFGRFLSLSQIPHNLASSLESADISPLAIMAGIMLMYLILGMFLDAVAILAITIPVVFPLILNLGYDPIWFGIIIVKISEIGLVTPPVGLNAYVAHAAAEGQVSLAEVFKGIFPFISCDIFVLVLLIIFPQISLYLPDLMFNS